MTRFKRPAAALGAAAVLAFSLTACGGGGGGSAPDDASKDDFCKAWNDAFTPLASLEGDANQDQLDKFKDAVDNLADVGTPSDISDDQRKGFEVFVDAVDDISLDDFNSDSGDDIPGVSKDDQAKVQDFVQWAFTDCTDVPSDLPTDSPS
ncbi:MAG TPA: hypothetical protein VNS55_05880 [Nocardioides sp.]|nr:hypothetical protein [Nocardioides sp.]